ncbi:MAG: hypothetical protein WDM78_09345 [Puia sp.]
MDVLLPPGTALKVELNQMVKGGVTVIGGMELVND